MNYSEAKKVLESNGQGHVLDFWGKLGVKARKSLLAQIATIDFKELARCRSMLPAFVCDKAEKPCAKRAVAPTAPKVAELKGKAYASSVAAGAKELAAGRVGVLLVAGGQGSRLGYEGPKGAYPIGPVTDKPLFHFHARKVLAKTLKYGKSVPFYVMTSEANYEATVACFKENGWFGLDRKDIFFFKQGMWPGMTEDG